MSIRMLFTATVFFFAAAAGAAESIDAVLKAAMKDTKTPALGVLVMRDGKVAQHAVRGVRRSDGTDSAHVGDVWLIGSTSKPMTIALIARLVERGTLAWDTPLAKMLPEIAETMRPEYRSVTLVQLLSHQSGMSENLQDLKFLDTFFSDSRPLPVQRMALITAALREPPTSPAGDIFVYCNTGYLIAAAIAEKVTGVPFEELMRREIFKPLGITTAGFGPTRSGQPRGHRDGKPATAAMTKSDDGVPMVYTAAGNMHMSLGDWAKFCLDQLSGSRGAGKLLSAASYKLMQTARPGSTAGVDWGVQESIAGRKGPVLVHGGSDGNWLAWAVLFPNTDTGVLVVANAAADMGADKALQSALVALFPGLSPPK